MGGTAIPACGCGVVRRSRRAFLVCTAEIQLGGWVDRNLRIWLNGAKMRSLQISADDVLNTVGREHLEVPAGRIEMPATEMNVARRVNFMRPSAEFDPEATA